MGDRWKVQATWEAEGERRSYAPQFARTRMGAERLRRQMEETLAHFPTLEVVVERVSAGDATAHATPQQEFQPVHLVVEPLAPMTACGLPTREVQTVAVAEVFALSGRQCETCADAGA
jgi:hypothetical protein